MLILSKLSCFVYSVANSHPRTCVKTRNCPKKTQNIESIWVCSRPERDPYTYSHVVGNCNDIQGIYFLKFRTHLSYSSKWLHLWLTSSMCHLLCLYISFLVTMIDIRFQVLFLFNQNAIDSCGENTFIIYIDIQIVNSLQFVCYDL